MGLYCPCLLFVISTVVAAWALSSWSFTIPHCAVRLPVQSLATCALHMALVPEAHVVCCVCMSREHLGDGKRKGGDAIISCHSAAAPNGSRNSREGGWHPAVVLTLISALCYSPTLVLWYPQKRCHDVSALFTACQCTKSCEEKLWKLNLGYESLQ